VVPLTRSMDRPDEDAGGQSDRARDMTDALLVVRGKETYITAIDLWPDNRAVSLRHCQAHVRTLLPNIDGTELGHA
jgi:hypothetical protein